MIPCRLLSPRIHGNARETRLTAGRALQQHRYMATTDSSKSTRTVNTCFLLPLRPPCISDAVSDQLHLHTPRATKKMKPTRMWPGP